MLVHSFKHTLRVRGPSLVSHPGRLQAKQAAVTQENCRLQGGATALWSGTGSLQLALPWENPSPPLNFHSPALK